MPEFLPFRGIRYASGTAASDLSPVTAPPYDVIDEEDRCALEESHPENAVRLILPREGDEGRSSYRMAADRLATWLRDGILRVDETPRMYLYRMEAPGDDHVRHTVGVIGALGLPTGGGDDGSILLHERTMPRAKSDRLELLRATRANLDPIWALSLAPGLSELLGPEPAMTARCTDLEGVSHRLYPLVDPERVAAIGRAVASAPVVLADGHHRFETACAYRDERRAAGADDAGAGRIMTLLVELAEDQLCVGAIHRLLSGLAEHDLRAALSGTFEVVPAGATTHDAVEALEARMRDRAALGLVDRNGLALLVPRPDVLGPRLAELPEVLRDVDAARFDAGIRPAVSGAQIGFRNDAAAVATLVDKGAADAAVLLRPVTVDQIRAAAFAGVRMPEKTTFFYPKPRTGLVFRSLDE